MLLQEKLLDQPEISEAVARLGGVRLGGSRASSEADDDFWTGATRVEKGESHGAMVARLKMQLEHA